MPWFCYTLGAVVFVLGMVNAILGAMREAGVMVAIAVVALAVGLILDARRGWR